MRSACLPEEEILLTPSSLLDPLHPPSIASFSLLPNSPPPGGKSSRDPSSKRRGPCTYWTQLTTSASIFALARVQRFTFLKAVCAYDERLDGWSSGSRTGLEGWNRDCVRKKGRERERDRWPVYSGQIIVKGRTFSAGRATLFLIKGVL